ncbi:polyamine aminopropyltransferase 2 [Kitasatospora sp. NE20-6]|uniref:spermine/spermidine synthase domain-containing protein n=1 Tax=Kitasatospora sp. NE20-6 TaxID=2859066 RepID=UPI0034DC0155
MINRPAGPPAQPGLDHRAGAPRVHALTRPWSGGTAPPGPRRRAARPLVLLAAFICAACGLVYELELVAVGQTLLGDSVTQTSVVLSVMVFAMGLGSLLAKRMARRPAASFALVESALALTGGLSVLALHSAWAWLGGQRAVTVGLTGTTFLIGLLIGAEIPLLMTLIQRIRREHAGRAVADLFAADYVGALVGGLAFPFLLLPALGPATGALATGAVNAAAGAAVVLWLFREEPAPRARLLLWACCALVLAVLAVAAAFTGAIERAARQALYGAQVRLAVQGRAEEIVVAGGAPGGGRPLEVFLDGRLAVCGPDEYREHEALVHPAFGGGPGGRVLVLGGQGMALREVLRHTGVREVLVVDPDPVLTGVVRGDTALAELTAHAYDDPRVRRVEADPLTWLHRAADGGGARPYDVIVSDLPAPLGDDGRSAHTREFFGMAARRLAPGGRLAVRGGPVADGLWAAEAGLRADGLRTVAYQAAGPAGPACPGTHAARGRSGTPAAADPADRRPAFLLAARAQPRLSLGTDAPPPRSLTAAGLQESAARLAARRPAHPPEPYRLLG